MTLTETYHAASDAYWAHAGTFPRYADYRPDYPAYRAALTGYFSTAKILRAELADAMDSLARDGFVDPE